MPTEQPTNSTKTLATIALLAIAIIAYFSFKPQKPEINTKQNTVIEESKSTITKHPETNKESQKENIAKAIESQENDTSAVIETVYDSDPVVDANLVLNENWLCFRYFEGQNNENYTYYVNRFKRKLSKKQQQYHQQFNGYCQQLNQQHPEYHLNDKQTLLKQKKNATPTSFWGEIVNGKVDVKTLSDTDIRNLLQQNDLTILTDAPKLLEDYYQRVVHWQLEDVLENHQYDYTSHIRRYAHQLYLCQLGKDCGPNSTIMATLCYLNAQSCGLDYPQYISQVLTPGQQADIQLALAYFNRIY
jgi:hypothetical protein